MTSLRGGIYPGSLGGEKQREEKVFVGYECVPISLVFELDSKVLGGYSSIADSFVCEMWGGADLACVSIWRHKMT